MNVGRQTKDSKEGVMSVNIPTICVGKPLRHEALSVFPLFTKADTGVEYVLADEALRNRSVVVKEVNESGSVPIFNDLVIS